MYDYARKGNKRTGKLKHNKSTLHASRAPYYSGTGSIDRFYQLIVVDQVPRYPICRLLSNLVNRASTSENVRQAMIIKYSIYPPSGGARRREMHQTKELRVLGVDRCNRTVRRKKHTHAHIKNTQVHQPVSRPNPNHQQRKGQQSPPRIYFSNKCAMFECVVYIAAVHTTSIEDDRVFVPCTSHYSTGRLTRNRKADQGGISYFREGVLFHEFQDNDPQISYFPLNTSLAFRNNSLFLVFFCTVHHRHGRRT